MSQSAQSIITSHRAAAARAVEHFKKTRGWRLSLSESLELVACVLGQPNWQTLQALAKKGEGPRIPNEASLAAPIGHSSSETIQPDRETELERATTFFEAAYQVHGQHPRHTRALWRAPASGEQPTPYWRWVAERVAETELANESDSTADAMGPVKAAGLQSGKATPPTKERFDSRDKVLGGSASVPLVSPEVSPDTVRQRVSAHPAAHESAGTAKVPSKSAEALSRDVRPASASGMPVSLSMYYYRKGLREDTLFPKENYDILKRASSLSGVGSAQTYWQWLMQEITESGAMLPWERDEHPAVLSAKEAGFGVIFYTGKGWQVVSKHSVQPPWEAVYASEREAWEDTQRRIGKMIIAGIREAMVKVQVPDELGGREASYAEGLKQFLRDDPDCIMLGAQNESSAACASDDTSIRSPRLHIFGDEWHLLHREPIVQDRHGQNLKYLGSRRPPLPVFEDSNASAVIRLEEDPLFTRAAWRLDLGKERPGDNYWEWVLQHVDEINAMLPWEREAEPNVANALARGLRVVRKGPVWEVLNAKNERALPFLYGREADAWASAANSPQNF